MKTRQHGAALIAIMVMMTSVLSVAAVVTMKQLAGYKPVQLEQQRNLALAVSALRAHAFARRCIVPGLPLTDALPCPDAPGTEGVAAASCPANSRGWLPWRTLGLPALRDRSGTCLWYERQGTTARVIAAGGAQTGQNRNAAAGRTICGGNLAAANYIDVQDVSLSMALDTTLITARCP
jgi:hypothetical protein